MAAKAATQASQQFGSIADGIQFGFDACIHYLSQ
jgi:hypothetical protein